MAGSFSRHFLSVVIFFLFPPSVPYLYPCSCYDHIKGKSTSHSRYRTIRPGGGNMTTAHQYFNRISLLIILSFFIVDSCLATIGAASDTGNNIPQAKQLHSGAEQKPDRAWMASIQKDIRHREYFFSSSGAQSGQVNGKIWQAPNRRQDVRIHADKNGIELRERRGAGKQLLHLRTVALGRVDSLRPLQIGHISAHDNRLEIQRHGLSEWYVNADKGIEQGFTVSERPQGTQALALEIECDSQPVLFSDTHLLFNSGGARPLDYGKLSVVDAKGKNIPSRFVLLTDNHFSIEMEDQDALYPLTIDPIITSSFDTLLHGDQTNEYFGTSVADAGDVNGDGYWDVIVGAPNYDNGQNNEGGVFLFLGGSSGLAQNFSWYWEGDVEGLKLGSRVAGGGDINGDGKDDFVVASTETYPSIQGKIIVFYGAGDVTSGLTYSGDIIGAGVNDKFGAAVSGAGDINGDGYEDIIVGAPGYGRGTVIAEGRAYVFYGSSSGINTLNPDEFSFRDTGQPADPSNYHFAAGVADGGDINGDGYTDILVATDRQDTGTSNTVYIYYGSAAGITTTSTFSAEIPSSQADSDFGRGLAGVGDLNGDGFADIGIGAPAYDGDGLTDQGAIFIHFGSSTGLSTTISPLAFKAGSNGARLGNSISGGGDLNGDGYSDLVAGACGHTLQNGAMYIYHGAAGGMAFSSIVQLSYNGIALGSSVAATGDVNGDGYADLIAGAPLLSVNPVSHCGGVFVFHGSADQIDNTPDFFLESNREQEHFGSAVSGAGDFNGDGYDDIIVGAEWFDRGQLKRGMAFLYYGPPGGLLWPFPLQLGGDAKVIAKSVSGAGDINGDGYDDVVISPFIYSNGEDSEGAVFLYYGSQQGIPSSYSCLLESNQAHVSLGAASGAGDVNRDGFDDLIAGADGYSQGEGGEGAGFLYLGSTTGLANSTPIIVEGNEANQHYGWSTAGVGDVNGDGFDDVIIGGRFNRARLYYGKETGLDLANTVTLQSPQNDSNFGPVLSGAGDVNGDGFADILIGAKKYDHGEIDEGAAFLYLGNSNGRPVRTSFVRSDGSHPIASRGLSYDENGFGLRMDLHSPRGGEMIRIEALVCPEMQPPPGVFSTCETFVSPWQDSTPAYTLHMAGLTPGLYFIQARLAYAPYGAVNQGIYQQAHHCAANFPCLSSSHGPWQYLHADSSRSVVRIGLPKSKFPWPMFLPAIISGRN